MLTWCMAYPWMTLTIAILALIVLDNAVANISNAIRQNNCRGLNRLK